MRAFSGGHLTAFDVLLIQEPNLSKHNRCEIAKCAELRGYHAFFHSGIEDIDTAGRPYTRGGLATFVRHGLPSRSVTGVTSSGDYEALQVRIGE